MIPPEPTLTASFRCSRWLLEDDGRLHTYTVVLALKLEQLPASSLPILSVAAPGQTPDTVYIYKNGGVGALGQMGTQEAAVRPNRWAWVVITREKDTLTTCAAPGPLRTRRPCPTSCQRDRLSS